jgi:hypothetical protein
MMRYVIEANANTKLLENFCEEQDIPLGFSPD